MSYSSPDDGKGSFSSYYRWDFCHESSLLIDNRFNHGNYFAFEATTGPLLTSLVSFTSESLGRTRAPAIPQKHEGPQPN